MRAWIALVLISGALGAAGCGGSNAERRRSDLEREAAFDFKGGKELARQGSFDLDCPAERLRAQVLDRVGLFRIAASAGIVGCGRKASYARVITNSAIGPWFLNGPIAAAPSDAPAAQPTSEQAD